MFYKVSFSLLVCLLSLTNLCAQTGLTKDELTNIDSFSTLNFVYGWLRNPKYDSWSTKEKEIKDIDKFETYALISFRANGSKYIAVVKQYEEKGYNVFDTYVIDYADYETQISKWESHSLLKFPILKYNTARLKKNQPVTNAVLGIDDLTGKLSHPRDSFVFQYKFSNDATVKFLFYVETCNSDECVVSGLNIKKKDSLDTYRLIGTDEMYNNFCYKTMYTYFVNFTDSPLDR